jgi:hypothetical protein
VQERARQILTDPAASAEDRRWAAQQQADALGGPPPGAGGMGGRFGGAGRPPNRGSQGDSRIGSLGNVVGNADDGIDEIEDLTEFLEEDGDAELFGDNTVVDAYPAGSPIVDTHDPRWAAAVAQNPFVFEKNQLTPDTLLYRAVDKQFLDMERDLAFGNPNSNALLLDEQRTVPHPEYGHLGVMQEHFFTAAELPERGLNVTTNPASLRLYARSDAYVVTEMRLGDMLSAGGKVYMDIGAVIQGALYVTLPDNQPIPVKISR